MCAFMCWRTRFDTLYVREPISRNENVEKTRRKYKIYNFFITVGGFINNYWKCFVFFRQ